MLTTRIRFALIAIGVSFASQSLWSQSAKLTGYVRDHRDSAPINGVEVVIAKLNKTTTSNSEGKYEISGLPPGAQINAIYKKAGYNSCADVVKLTGETTEHNVPLFQDLPLDAYWNGYLDSVQTAAGGEDTQRRHIEYLKAWQLVDDSTISPEAKATAAHKFVSRLDRSKLGGNPIPITLAAYSTVDRDRISDTKVEFRSAITKSGTLEGKVAMVPGNVAADIAAQQIGEEKAPPKLNFLTSFERVYGKIAYDELTVKTTNSSSCR
jgi:hypothetical protein